MLRVYQSSGLPTGTTKSSATERNTIREFGGNFRLRAGNSVFLHGPIRPLSNIGNQSASDHQSNKLGCGIESSMVHRIDGARLLR